MYFTQQPRDIHPGVAALMGFKLLIKFGAYLQL